MNWSSSWYGLSDHEQGPDFSRCQFHTVYRRVTVLRLKEYAVSERLFGTYAFDLSSLS
ncbi:MAG: hypothetical protein RLO05_11785 [Rhodospirillales bacterium]|tara:strand:+ start:395 stop:568 length:174 start_codon:yes stop_codon:yes gene_type:complete